MGLFCTAIRSDSVSLLRFHFLSHVLSRVRLRLYVAWNIHTLFFFPSFYPVILANVVFVGCSQSSSTFFYEIFESLYRCIDATWNTSESSDLFSWQYSPSASSVWCKASCIVMIFHVVLLIYWSSSLVLFMNDLEYFTRRTAQVFIFLMRSLWCLFLSSFLVLQRYLYFFPSFISTCFMVSA